ncbi:hypothetical protein [Streptomyces noursei]|uniref:hypothetical protein n=1 Tax=Streptomyces noursei TaxID=1971 RepID=UPI00167849E5|nr:hypothetical protein [Streptomyces noursei]MCZ1019406.1 hypothetical protein [Streptomyces noursei]GGX08186.1 hypothetical protein GCM10010341_32310 [Streptomyces noursei]
MRARARLDLNERAMERVMSSAETAKMLSQKASKVAATARHDAPKNKRGSWNMYARSISVTAGEIEGIVHAFVQADRHPLLIEYGWRDKGGTRHPGRHILKNALMKERGQ